VNTEVIRRLVHLMAIDDALAFKQFFDLLYARFYRLAFYCVKSDDLSEEIVSDVLLKIWNNRKRLPEINNLDVYFFKSIKNQAYTYLKREARRAFLDAQSVKSLNLEYAEPENLLIAKDLAHAVEQAVSALPDKCQMIFRLIREDGMTYKDVADLLELSIKTVENQMTIAIKKLKCAVDDHYQMNLFYKSITFLE
jgi:RNA polymerase sigma-70 factor (family 1)